MESGILYDRQKLLKAIKVGDYIRWKPLPLTAIEVHSYFIPSSSKNNPWQYGLVLDLLESPRYSDAVNPKIHGLHLRLLRDGKIDWIFNFEYFNEIEIVGRIQE